MAEAHIIPDNPVFSADPALCIACGRCVADCPTNVLELRDRVAVSKPHFAEACIDCQHCLAICPTAAASVGGRNPALSEPVREWDYQSLARLVRGRRSIRFFEERPVPREILMDIINTASYAPAGVNARDRSYLLVEDPATLAAYRDRVCRAVVDNMELFPGNWQWVAKAAQKWLEKGRDVVFRKAPHMVVITSGPRASTPQADCLIAMTYLDLLAQARGVGTLWNGMLQAILTHLPQSRAWLGIPDDHVVGYAMVLGWPAVRYARTVQHFPERSVILKNLG